MPATRILSGFEFSSSFSSWERLDGQPMKGCLSIVLSLWLAFGVTAGAMAHAAEPGSGTRVLASMDACGSYSKKSDKSQSDPSKMSVEFHGCHGHHVGIPVASAPEIEQIGRAHV